MISSVRLGARLDDVITHEHLLADGGVLPRRADQAAAGQGDGHDAGADATTVPACNGGSGMSWRNCS